MFKLKSYDNVRNIIQYKKKDRKFFLVENEKQKVVILERDQELFRTNGPFVTNARKSIEFKTSTVKLSFFGARM